jgi:Ca-activated chloride channel family protein
VRSALNSDQLATLAEFGGGIYRVADFRDNDTDAVLRAAAVSQMPPQSRDERTRVWNERYWIPVLLVMLLLLPQFRALGWRRRTPT